MIPVKALEELLFGPGHPVLSGGEFLTKTVEAGGHTGERSERFAQA